VVLIAIASTHRRFTRRSDPSSDRDLPTTVNKATGRGI
jgi:hypothetical protein